ncbi:MAG: hypothetical protein V4486_00120 [Patescibacteria group bacterium]
MSQGDYFFLIFLGTIAISRLFVAFKVKAPTLGSFRVRHYMYGVILILVAIFLKNITLFAISLGLILDELPVILIKGPGTKDEAWHGCEDYKAAWCVAGVFILTLLVFVFRNSILGLL